MQTTQSKALVTVSAVPPSVLDHWLGVAVIVEPTAKEPETVAPPSEYKPCPGPPPGQLAKVTEVEVPFFLISTEKI